MMARYAVLIVVLIAPFAVADSLSDWLVGELEYEFIKRSIPEESRAPILAAAAEHTQGYRLTDFDPCQLDALMGALRQAQHRFNNVPSAVEHNKVEFIRALLEALHAPAYDMESPREVQAQIAALTIAARETIATQYPDLAEPALLDDLEQTWFDTMWDLAERCTSRSMKAPLPADVFETLVERVRNEPVPGFQVTQIERMQDRSHPASRALSAARAPMGFYMSESGVSGSSAWAASSGHGTQAHPSPYRNTLAMAGLTILRDAQREWLRQAGPASPSHAAALEAAYAQAGVDDAAKSAAFEVMSQSMRDSSQRRSANRPPLILEDYPINSSYHRENMELLMAPALMVQQTLQQHNDEDEETPVWPAP